jgi:hypothetical protein
MKYIYFLILTASLSCSALAGNYDIYGSVRFYEEQGAEYQQAWEQNIYEQEQAQQLDEINWRLQELQEEIGR